MTGYTFNWHGGVGQLQEKWTLHLELVDPAGAPDPGEPGATAAVNLGCNNAGVGLPAHPYVATTRSLVGNFFWHHPDLAESIPPGKYHCNHLDMGPHGHQGLITVVVQDDRWTCTASYKGTNSTSTNPLLSPDDPPSAADIARSVKNGTASTPKCSPLR
jgi:hypothetical protein